MDLKPGYQRTNAGVIPDDWQVCPVGSKGEVRAGKALASKGAGTHRPYLRTKNVFDGRIDVNDVLKMPMSDAEFATYRLRRDDVLLNEGQSLEFVGRCAIYRDEYPAPCAIQNQLIRFRAGQGTSAELASHLFRYSQAIGVFARIALQTTSVAHLGVSRFKALELPWPAEETEQQAIAHALSDADALIESLEQLLAKKRQIKQGAMQELLTGKRRLPGFDCAWVRKQVREVASIDPENLGSGSAPDFRFNYISLEDVDKGDLRSFSEQTFGSAPSRARRVLRESDILVSTVRPNLLSHLFVNWDTESKWISSTGFSVVRCNRKAHPKYLYFHLFGSQVSRQIDALLTGSNYPAINGSDVGNLWIDFPEVPEQVAISSVLTSFDEELNVIEKRLAKTRDVKQGMMQVLLTGGIRLLDGMNAQSLELVHSG